MMNQRSPHSEVVKGHSIWLLPDKETASSLKKVIKRFSQLCLAPEFPPHVTLLGQLDLESEVLTKRVQAFARNLEPLPVHLGPTGLEDTYFRSLYLRVSPDEQLQELFTQAYTEIIQVSATKDYLPHLSLLYSHLERHAKEDLLKASQLEVEFDAVLEWICLMRTAGPPDEWTLVAEYPLK